MSNEETKLKIDAALKGFHSGSLTANAIRLFDTLGYASEKHLAQTAYSPEEFLNIFNRNVSRPLNPAKALVDFWKQLHFLFQLTADEIKAGSQMGFDFGAKTKVDNAIIESYLFFALELEVKDYTRTELATITREINKIFNMPVMILFQYGESLTLSIIDRRLNKIDDTKDVLKKVTLIKDISITQPHRAHIEILFDLSLDALQQQFGFSNFVELHTAWQKALDSSELNKKFFKELSNWYFWALQNVTFPQGSGADEEVRNATSVIRLITRLIFIWFIKEKNLVPDELFNQSKLKDILKYNDVKDSTYYKAILQNLFFATLNQEMNTSEKPNNRQFRGKSKQPNGRDQHFGITNLYRYQDYFQNPAEALKLFSNIPFLNGGLFECLDKLAKDDPTRIIRIDGFSDHQGNEISVPDFLFFSKERYVDLSEAYGVTNKMEKVRGLIDVLERYKFTINENTPIEEEVALDPELLGKVFENLLASYNPETKTTARKGTGSFYTPREIVNYMVDESLVAYLSESLKKKLPELAKTDGLDEILREVFAYKEYKGNDHYFNPKETVALVDAIDNVKALDPACGSGAFPMGILHKLVFILGKLDPHNKLWKDRQLANAQKLDDIEARDGAIRSIEDSFARNELDYGRKLYLIQNCIYGVDIQPIAVQIAKLRFFISLVVDQKLDEKRENRGILPLPNLETKFVAANTLIELDKPKFGQKLVLRSPAVIQKEIELANIRKEYFAAKTPVRKRKCRESDANLRSELADLLKEDGFPGKTAKILADWDPYDQNTYAEWFDPEWMFGWSGGFDIVIGNPPYIQLQKDGGTLADLYKNCNYKTFERTGDIYSLFYERGISLLNTQGHLCFITSNKWMRAGYGESLRNYFLTKNPCLLVDLGPGVFENATVDTNILIVQNAANKNCLNGLTLTAKAKDKDLAEFINQYVVKLPNMTKNAWFIANDAEQKLKEKIESIGTPLRDWNVNLNYGIKTGLNEAFVIDTATKERLCQEDPKNKEIIKPILRGRNIYKYVYEWAGLWLIFIPWHFPLHENQSIQGASQKAENEFVERYPSIHAHLLQFKASLLKRNLAETGIRYEWYALQRCAATYYNEFEKEKLIWQEICKESSFSYDNNGVFCNDTGRILTGSNIKYLLGFFNTKFFQTTYSRYYAGGALGEKGIRFKSDFMKDYPIPPVTSQNLPIVKMIESIVEHIINDKKHNPTTRTSALEAKIEQLVFQLYDLTPEEIEVVEGKTQI